jgi:hypothetical protein
VKVSARTLTGSLLLALLLTACSDTSEPGGLFSEAEDRWERAGYSAYVFTAERSCFCTEEGRGPVRVTVRNGAVTSVVMISTGAAVETDVWFTIEGVFDLIREQLRTLPSRLDAEYHQTLGYPTKVTYGTPENDGGGIIFVRDLVRG